MERKYEHLSAEERATIMMETERGASVRSIARRLDRSASTISRELSRGRPCPASRYRATEAARRYQRRRRASVRPHKIVEGNWLWQRVRDGLCYRFWSPQQIAARLRGMHPDDSERQVSAETIYRAIYAHPRGSLKAEMVAALRPRVRHQRSQVLDFANQRDQIATTAVPVVRSRWWASGS